MASLRQLKVTFDSFEDLVESIGRGLSRTHIFVPTDEVIAGGTRVRLEIGTLPEGTLIRGMAKVAVDVEEMPGETAPSGRHLHLIHLDPSSTRLVDSIVRGETVGAGAGEKSGPSPFDIPSAEPEPAGPESKESEPAPPEPPEQQPPEPQLEEPESEAWRPGAEETPEPAVAARDAKDHPPGSGRHFGWPLALAALAGLFLLMFQLVPGRDEDQLLTGRDRQTEAAAPEPPAVTAPDAMAAGTVEDVVAAEDDPPSLGDPLEPEAPDPDRQDIESTVFAWADAWSRQDPAAYIELYAADFSPGGLDRDTWERQRRSRITAPERLEVSISDLEVEVAGPERAIVRFRQLYATGDKALSARKILELQRFETGWKIVSERMEP